MSGRLTVCALLVAALLLPHAATQEGTGPTLGYWTAHSLVKVRPHDPPAGTRTAELVAARNEFESFQIVLRADRDTTGVDARASALVADGGAAIPERHVTLYRAFYVDLARPSSEEGAAGEWPDPLVPRVDRYAGERRNAFPFTVPRGRNQPLWVEIHVPAGAEPGHYRGEVEITVAGDTALTVPVELRVRPPILPSTSSLATSFGFSGRSAVREHGGDVDDPDELVEMTRRYGKALLLHRLSFYGGSMEPPEIEGSGDDLDLEWEDYEEEMEPFLEGEVLTGDDALSGARVTSVDVRTPSLHGPAERVAYWRRWSDHFRERGWHERLFVYLWDEPRAGEHYSRVAELGRLARRADPDLRTLLTEQRAEELDEVVDIWVPLINCVDESAPGASPCEETVDRGRYRDGESVWWYQSCASHGCGIVGGSFYRGWPSYVIDAPPVAARVMAWLAWRYGIDGELYYNTVEIFGRDGDPWEQPWAHGGNGDGTLFYPGTPERIGGDTHIPVESIRLKLIRDGLEDYEYLAMLTAAEDDPEFADRQARTVAARTYRWTKDPEVMLAARRRLLDRLSRVAAGDADVAAGDPGVAAGDPGVVAGDAGGGPR